MSTSPSSSAKQAQTALGVRLREIRRDAGLNGRELAAATGMHFSKISREENGRQPPSDKDIRMWCTACDAEDQIPDLIAEARSVQSAYLELRRQTRAGMKRLMLSPVPLYERTKHWRIYEHNVIPGLFQTAEYAAAMLSFWIGFLDAPNDIEAAVAARMERQRVVHSGARRFSVVLEEPALRTWFGGADVQGAQLERLLADMSLPTVAVGIIPMMIERSGVGSAGFWIFDDTMVCLETPTASIEVTRPQEIGLYAKMFENLKASAVYGADARALIARALADLR